MLGELSRDFGNGAFPRESMPIPPEPRKETASRRLSQDEFVQLQPLDPQAGLSSDLGQQGQIWRTLPGGCPDDQQRFPMGSYNFACREVSL